MAMYRKFCKVWLILYLFLPNEKPGFFSLLAKRVKQLGENKIKSIGLVISLTTQTIFYCC